MGDVPIELEHAKSCLDCRYLSKPEFTHEWYGCSWEATEAIPKSVQPIRVSVNPAAPFENCAAWGKVVDTKNSSA